MNTLDNYKNSIKFRTIKLWRVDGCELPLNKEDNAPYSTNKDRVTSPFISVFADYADIYAVNAINYAMDFVKFDKSGKIADKIISNMMRVE